MNNILDRAKGAFIGLAVGDALGTSIEFKDRDTYSHLTDIIGGGPFMLEAGQWTDDTSMALCLAESLLEKNEFSAQNLLEKFSGWMKNGYNSSTGRCFDIGNITKQALLQFGNDGYPSLGPTDPNSAGNGSIMRLAPAVLFSLNERERAIELSILQSQVTHAAPEVLDACKLMGALMFDYIVGQPNPKIDLTEPKIIALMQNEFQFKERPQIYSTGYVVDTLEAALWSIHHSDNFKDAVLLAVNLGHDSDTVGAVTGQLAGAKWGYSGIPSQWVSKVLWHEKIVNMALSLADKGLKYGLAPTPQLTTMQP